MNIILIGYMGSGKTTIGKALAHKKGLKFLDTDEIIERQQSITIKEMFSTYGEEYFREIERQTIEQLKGIDNSVIAVGGGAVMHHNNFDVLKSIGTTVFLDAPLEKLLKNLKGKFRPLVGDTIDKDKMRELLNRRYPTYRKADVVIDTDNLDIQQSVDEIIKRLNL